VVGCTDRRRPALRAAILLAVLLVAAASPAVAQGLGDIIVAKAKTLVVVVLFCSFVFQVAFVRLGATFFGFEGGVMTAALAVVLGGVFIVIIAVVGSFLALALPSALQGIFLSAAAMVGGAFAIKLLFKAEFAQALLIYLAALTLNSAGVAVVLILMY
jgi:hypothetical protein